MPVGITSALLNSRESTTSGGGEPIAKAESAGSVAETRLSFAAKRECRRARETREKDQGRQRES